MKSLDNYWGTVNPVSLILLPVSLSFCALVILRRLLYRLGLVKSYRISRPVIIIGNITVGGSGKTPLIIELARLLKKQGLKPGVVSRGYGGGGPFPLAIDSDVTPSQAGDEPVQIVQRADVPMVVGPDRVDAANTLVSRYDVDLILADDGLQHYRLERDLEIVVVEQQRKFGNGLCLPAGPLREPVSRLRNADWILYNGGKGWDSYSIVATSAINITTGESRLLSEFDKVHAVAGIGNPGRFFHMLASMHITTVEHAFPDHYVYKETDIEFNDDLPVLMTEKDSVKCGDFNNPGLWYVPVDVTLSDRFKNEFQQKINVLCHG